MTKESLTAFESFYTNHDQIQDKFTAYWKEVSKHFSENPNIIGFNPMSNAPPGNPFYTPSIIAPGVSDRKRLAPLYEKAFMTFQANNKQSLMWFEPTSLTDALPVFSGVVAPIGFDTPPGS